MVMMAAGLWSASSQNKVDFIICWPSHSLLPQRESRAITQTVVTHNLVYISTRFTFSCHDVWIEDAPKNGNKYFIAA
jgi:hypothetical protein